MVNVMGQKQEVIPIGWMYRRPRFIHSSIQPLYTDKYEKRFEAQNINNYMIVTNSNLKGVNGRRYLVCDLSSKHLDDFKYYANLRNKCFNDIVYYT